jgi:hypothetical protein
MSVFVVTVETVPTRLPVQVPVLLNVCVVARENPVFPVRFVTVATVVADKLTIESELRTADQSMPT